MQDEQEMHGEQNKPNLVERGVRRMMGGTTVGGGGGVDIAVGAEYGRTPYSAEPEAWYEQTRGSRQTLDAAEYYVVSQGYLREWTCMGQCNLYLQVLRKDMLRQSLETYRNDVCAPNVTEMKNLLEAGGYQLPAPYNAIEHSFDLEQLGQVDTDVIDDRMILVGHIFTVEAFMNRWNEGVRHAHRADVRDAFVRNYHRANRWHLATIAMAEKMQFIEPQPQITPA